MTRFARCRPFQSIALLALLSLDPSTDPVKASVPPTPPSGAPPGADHEAVDLPSVLPAEIELLYAWSTIDLESASHREHALRAGAAGLLNRAFAPLTRSQAETFRGDVQRLRALAFRPAADHSSVTTNDRGSSGLGSVTGRVSAAGTGVGLEHITVYARGANNQFLGSGLSDADGDYEITGLLPGDVFVHTVGDSMLAEVYDDIPCIAGQCSADRIGDPVPVVADTVTSGIDFVLTEGGRIAGTVVDDSSGDPIAGVKIIVFDDTGAQLSGIRTTDAAGEFTSFPLPPGSYYVQARPAPNTFLREFHDGAQCLLFSCDLQAATLIAVADGSTEDIEFRLEWGGSITGRVSVAGSGDPVTSSVWLYDDTGGYVYGVGTAADGTYAIGELLSGNYFLHTINNQGYFEQLYNGLPYAFAQPVTTGNQVAVAVGVETPGIDFELTRGAGIEGTIRHETTGDPLPGANVFISGPSDTVIVSADHEGAYWSGPLEAGTYHVHSNHPGYLGEWYDGFYCLVPCPEVATPVEVTEGVTVSGIDIGLVLAAQISGTIVAEDTGEPIEGATVYAKGPYDQSATTGPDGTYVIDGLRAGSHTVYASHPSFQRRVLGGGYCSGWTGECERAGGSPVAVAQEAEVAGVDLALPTGGVIRGTITSNQGGAPVADVIVWIYDDQGVPQEGAVSEADGAFVFGPVPTAAAYYMSSIIVPAGFFRETWNNHTAAFFPGLSPAPQVLFGDPIQFGPSTEFIADMSLDPEGGRKTLTLTASSAELGAGGVVGDQQHECAGASCDWLLPTGSVRVLRAMPEAGSVFVHWIGDPDCLDGIVTVESDTTCTAMFEVETPLFADGFESGDLSVWWP